MTLDRSRHLSEPDPGKASARGVHHDEGTSRPRREGVRGSAPAPSVSAPGLGGVVNLSEALLLGKSCGNWDLSASSGACGAGRRQGSVIQMPRSTTIHSLLWEIRCGRLSQIALARGCSDGPLQRTRGCRLPTDACSPATGEDLGLGLDESEVTSLQPPARQSRSAGQGDRGACQGDGVQGRGQGRRVGGQGCRAGQQGVRGAGQGTP